MAERRAVNKYYPPDWNPDKGSINKKSHPLRDRAKKISEGILVIRFEMPFNILCLGCDNHIAMGVRYNAEKRKVGNYYTSPIYQFKMKCHLCETYFIIQTDPGKFDYVILSGARRRAQTTLNDEDESLHLPLLSNDDSKRRMTDAMFRLEKQLEDKTKGESQLPTLKDLEKWRKRWEDNFAVNQIARSQFRKRRKEIDQKVERDSKLLKKASLDMLLVTPQTSDKREAKDLLTQFRGSKSYELDRKSRILNANQFVRPKSKLNPSSINLIKKETRE